MLDFRMLGPLEVWHGDRPLDVGGPQRRALLACVLTRSNALWTRDALIEALWGESPPDQAPELLRSLVSRLRRVLEPDRPAHTPSAVLPSSPGGYTLVVDESSIDAVRFAALLEDAQKHLAAGKPADALDKLGPALALWRGDALVEHAHFEFARTEAARLEELRTVALEVRHEALLEAGDHAKAASELETLVEQHPYRERLWELYLLALYRSGRQADALRSYQKVRARLIEELGVDPGPALQRLERSILAQDPELEVAPAWRAIPLPALSIDERLPFVGREVPLERLDEAVRRALTTRRQLVTVAGEPGIGKTRLVDEAARRAARAGVPVFTGRCTEEAAVPYQPFVDALRQFIAGAPLDGLADGLGRFAGELVRLAPELETLAPGLRPATRSDPETERYRLFDAVAAWLGTCALRNPAIIVIDDLQWASRPTLDLVLHLAESPQVGKTLVIGTYRDTDVAENPALGDFLARLHRVGGTERIRLDGLSPSEVSAVLSAVPGLVEPELVAEVVHRDTNGNPFFLGEVIREFEETGELRASEGIRSTIEIRIRRLGEQAPDALAAAAVVGTRFRLPVVAEAARLDEDTTLAILERCVAVGLVAEDANEPDAFGFVHTLVRSTVLDALSSSRRARLHHRVGLVLEAGRSRPSATELAHHFLAAGTAGDPERAVRYGLAAAEAALAGAANEEAIGLCESALALIDLDHPRHHRLLTIQGTALRARDTPEARDVLVKAMEGARKHEDTEWLARAALAARRDFWSGVGGIDDRVVTALEQAVELVGHGDLKLRARLLSSLAAEMGFEGDGERQEKLSNEALRLARHLDEVDILTEVLMLRRLSIWERELESRLAVTDELERLIDQVDDPVLKWRSHGACIVSRLEAGQVGRAQSHVDQLEVIGSGLGDPRAQWSAAYHKALLAQLSGDLDEFDRQSEIASQIGHPHSGVDRMLARAGQAFMLLVERGRFEEAMEYYDLAADYAPEQHEALLGAGALLCAGLGRHDEARQFLTRFVSSWPAHRRHDPLRVMSLCLATEAAHRLGTDEVAEFLYSELASQAGSLAVTSGFTLGAVDRFLGQAAATLGRYEDAEHHYQDAGEIHRVTGARGLLARTRADWAEALIARGRRGDRDRARDLLDGARDTARDLGLEDLEQRARQLLDELRNA